MKSVVAAFSVVAVTGQDDKESPEIDYVSAQQIQIACGQLDQYGRLIDWTNKLTSVGSWAKWGNSNEYSLKNEAELLVGNKPLRKKHMDDLKTLMCNTSNKPDAKTMVKNAFKCEDTTVAEYKTACESAAKEVAASLAEELNKNAACGALLCGAEPESLSIADASKTLSDKHKEHTAAEKAFQKSSNSEAENTSVKKAAEKLEEAKGAKDDAALALKRAMLMETCKEEGDTHQKKAQAEAGAAKAWLSNPTDSKKEIAWNLASTEAAKAKSNAEKCYYEDVEPRFGEVNTTLANAEYSDDRLKTLRDALKKDRANSAVRYSVPLASILLWQLIQ